MVLPLTSEQPNKQDREPIVKRPLGYLIFPMSRPSSNSNEPKQCLNSEVALPLKLSLAKKL